MANNLPPALLQQLADRGIIPQSQVPANAPSPTASIDANNANFQGAFAQMTPAEKQAAVAQAAQGTQSALAGALPPQAPPPPMAAAAPASAQGVFAPQAGQDQGQPFRLTGARPGSGGMAAPSGGTAISMVSPQTRAMVDQATADKLAAADQASEAEQAGAQNEAAGALNIRDTLASQKEAMDRAEGARRKAYDAQQADYDRIRGEADRGEIKPEDVPLMGHIAIALGAAGAALTGTPNFALQSINKRIDDNMAAQRDNLANKRKGAEEAREGLGQMRARFGDERVADAAERARQLEQAKATGDVMVAQSKSPMLAAKWAGIRAGIEAEQAQQHGAMEKWMPAGMGGGNKLDALTKELYVKNYGHPGNTVEAARQEAAKLLGIGEGGAAPVISGAPKAGGGAMSPRLARRMADLDSSDKAAARLQSLLTKPGGSLSLEERAQAEADANLLRNAGYHNVPEKPLEVLSSSDARKAGVTEVRRAIADERAGLTRYGAGGGGEGEPEENGDEFIRPAGSP